MIEKIKSAIKGLNELSTMYGHKWIREDCELAIRSLQAWSEVLNELEKERDFFTSISGEYAKGSVFATSKAIDIINKHLAEIEE